MPSVLHARVLSGRTLARLARVQRVFPCRLGSFPRRPRRITVLYNNFTPKPPGSSCRFLNLGSSMIYVVLSFMLRNWTTSHPDVLPTDRARRDSARISNRRVHRIVRKMAERMAGVLASSLAASPWTGCLEILQVRGSFPLRGLRNPTPGGKSHPIHWSMSARTGSERFASLTIRVSRSRRRLSQGA